jgi:hypothetical protein
LKPANPKAAREILKTKKSQIKEKSSSDNTGSNSRVGTSSPTKYQPSPENDATDMSAYNIPTKTPDQDVENDRQDEEDAEVLKIKFTLTLKRSGV